MENKYHYNEEMYAWEKIVKVQYYKGTKIESISSHADYFNAPHHRFYRVTWLDGHVSDFGIDKRGGNIKELKAYIDFKTR